MELDLSQETKSFEISQWFSSVLNRIDNISSHQKYLNKWRLLALKLKQSKRLSKIKYFYSKYRQKKCSKSSKENWISFYSKLWHRKKKKIFNTANNQLRDAKQKAEDLRRAKKILMISEDEYEDEDYNENSDSELTTNQNIKLSSNQEKWISMAQRFSSQTKYNELLKSYQEYLEDLNYQSQERRDVWQRMAHILLWNIQKNQLKKCFKRFNQARFNWKELYSNYILTHKLEYVKKVYSKWSGLSLRTDSQIRRCWIQFYFAMRMKKNIIRMVRESSALARLTNFFRYIMLIRRSVAVAKYFPIRYVANVRSIVKKATIDSADKIRRFATLKINRDNDIFAENWSNCIAEAFSAVASHQVGPPALFENRKRKPKAKPKQKDQNNPNAKTKMQTFKSNPNRDDQDDLGYPVKIIKITRDFDPNEEESEKEFVKYLSEDSDGENDEKGKEISIKSKDHAGDAPMTEINKSNNDQILVLTSPRESTDKKIKKDDVDIMIDLYPSNSQSTASFEDYVNSNTDNDDGSNNKLNNNNKISNDDNKVQSRNKLKIETTLNKEFKPKPEKKHKNKELYVPYVTAKRKDQLSPIKKKKHHSKKGNPSISDILDMVGVYSSLELLDEGYDSSGDNSNSSSIHFRFDDDSSEPMKEPYNDLMVDLLNVNSSSEERRIHQSLLEASEASSNLPNEEEDREPPNLKEEKKIDLLDPNSINDASASPSSYNSHESIKDENPILPAQIKNENGDENKLNILDENFEEEEEPEIPNQSDDKKLNILDGVLIEEDENEILPSLNDKRTDLLDNIGIEEEDIHYRIEKEEEEDISCPFNFDSEKREDKEKEPRIKNNSQSMSEQKSLIGRSNSYISDGDVDAAIHDYSEDQNET